MRKLIQLVLLLILLLTFAPLGMGMWLQHTYYSLVSYYNAQGDVAIQVLNYQRGWMSSSASLRVKIINPTLVTWVKESGVVDPQLDLLVEQKIQHGPILYYPAQISPFYFGLAVIHNQWQLSSAMQEFLKVFATVVGDIQDDDVISFAGNYIKYFKINSLYSNLPNQQVSVQFKQGLTGKIELFPGQNKLNATIKFPDVILLAANKHGAMKASAGMLQLDQQQAKSGLWLGYLKLQLAALTAQDFAGYSFSLAGLNLAGTIKERAEKIASEHIVDIEKITLAKQTFGPLHLKVTSSALISQAVVDMIIAYRQIMQRGELYASQLQLKMLSLLPKVLVTDSQVQLDAFHLSAPEGDFDMTGQIAWPYQGKSAYDFEELVRDMNLEVDARVSKPLLNPLIENLTHIPYFHNLSNKARQEVLSLDEAAQLVNQQSYLYIVMLVDTKQLDETTALSLLEAQKNNVSLDQYAQMLRTLFINGQVKRPLTYTLYWQYRAVMDIVTVLKQKIVVFENSAMDELKKDFNEWLKLGYVQSKGDDYTLSFIRESSVTKINGKEIID